MTTLVCLLSLVALLSLLPYSRAASGTYSISYHIYGTGQSSSQCYPSESATKWAGYVTATTNSAIGCGQCVKMTSTSKYGGKTIYAVRIDIGGQGFDLNEPAFMEMCGNQGYLDGHCDISYTTVAASYCNSWISQHGGTGTALDSGSPPPPTTTTGSTPPPPTTGGTGSGTVRCGADWTEANNNCYASCSTDANCPSGKYCFKDLKSCGGVSPPPPPTTTTTTGSTGSGGCPANYYCTGSNPAQNPAVDWTAYCNQKQGGQNFCQLGISGCACVPIGKSESDTQATTASGDLSVGAWVGVGVIIGLVVLAVIVGAIVYVKRRRVSETI